jgi:hypothetical protein
LFRPWLSRADPFYAVRLEPSVLSHFIAGMNHRLLTPAEKAENARGRNCRNAQQQARRRRAGLLWNLARTVPADVLDTSGAINGGDSLLILKGHLHAAKAIAKRLRWLALRESPGSTAPSDGLTAARTAGVPRPAATLRLENRSRVMPQMVPESAAETSMSVTTALAAAALMKPSRLSDRLDFIAGAADVPWMTAAELLLSAGLATAPLASELVVSTEAAREFWTLYAEGEHAFRAGMNAGDFPALAGRWGYFDEPGLLELLPGLHLPIRFARIGYLVQLVEESEMLCLDLHAAPQAFALTRHPFVRPPLNC